jgi:hypothetical protein
MAILAIFKGKGFNKEMYQKLRQELDLENENPVGGIFHAAAFDEAGNIRVADVWESREDMDKFFEDRLVPAFRKLNIPMPSPEVFPLYDADAYSKIDEYKD